MPWKVSHIVMERTVFISRLQAGEKMVDLCQEYGISRKTGYKFLERFEKNGMAGLYDQSRRPSRLARSTPQEVEALILELRHERPTWGAAKIREMLARKHPGLRLPVRSTVHEILDRNGLIKHKRRQAKGKMYPSVGLRDAKSPNELWCADFKGQFRLGNNVYCYPLTITDYASRYLIACEGLENTRTDGAKEAFEIAFKEHGLPIAIRSDNGSPFSTRGLLGLSQLSIWWLKLGIEHERITPGKPQQNGRHERMHRTLKQETTKPIGKNFLQQQERFDLFMHDFNNERPHEGLSMATPASKYKESDRSFPKYLPEPEYPDCDHTCYVNRSGRVYLPRHGDFNLTLILAGETVGMKQVDEKLWDVMFMDLQLGHYDEQEGVFHVANSSQTR